MQRLTTSACQQSTVAPVYATAIAAISHQCRFASCCSTDKRPSAAAQSQPALRSTACQAGCYIVDWETMPPSLFDPDTLMQASELQVLQNEYQKALQEPPWDGQSGFSHFCGVGMQMLIATPVYKQSAPSTLLMVV